MFCDGGAVRESSRSLSAGPLRHACSCLRSLLLRRSVLRTRTPRAHRSQHRRTAHDLSAPISRFNMDNFVKSHFWFVTAAFLAASGIYAGAGVGNRRPFTPSDSILDIINTEHVEKLLAERRRAEQATASTYVQRNELGDGSSETVMMSASEPEDSTGIPPGVDFRKILKSSKSAFVVTQRDYLREDWCKTETLIQKIREPGCLPTRVVNKFCYGQCNSFYIPKGPRRRDGNDERPPPAFKSCSFCKPRNMTLMTVKLRCPGLNPPFRLKRLQKIKLCKCIPVGVN